MDNSANLIIAIDGYSSCGKSTFAKAIAREMAYVYIDSGAMYRAVTLFCIQKSIIRNGEIDTRELSDSLENIHIDFVFNEQKDNSEIRLNKVIVEDKIRMLDVSEYVSQISCISEVRRKMVSLQREMGKDKGIVMDGRDIGTVVFPEAEMKIFMTADPHVRAIRRYKEMIQKGIKANLEEIEKNINQRDRIDTTRDDSPLKMAGDAILLDNTNMTPEDQMEWFRGILKTDYR